MPNARAGTAKKAILAAFLLRSSMVFLPHPKISANGDSAGQVYDFTIPNAACNAKAYPSAPSPLICPTATGAMCEWWRKDSRL